MDQREWDDVELLLRKFLLPSCSLGCDENIFRYDILRKKQKEIYREMEFIKRLRVHIRSQVLDEVAPPPWEGVTWISSSPDHPRVALQVLEGYFQAHCTILPDGRINGLFDAMQIIRSTCIERPRSEDDAIRLLMAETSRTLEHLVERLYRAMGYRTNITPRQKDGGYDVHATKRDGVSEL